MSAGLQVVINGQELYQNHRFKNLPPGLISVLLRFGFCRRPQIWYRRELYWCPYLFLLSFYLFLFR